MMRVQAHVCLAIVVLLYVAVCTHASVAIIDAPLSSIPTAMPTTGQCIAVDLQRQVRSGTVQRGSSAVELPAGRYRLHALLALAPLGDLQDSAITITLVAGGAQRTLGMLHFAKADEFTDQTLEFSLPAPGFATYTINWALTGAVAERNRKRALDNPPTLEPGEVNEANEELFAQAENGAMAIKDLPKLTYHLAVGAVSLERLSPVQVSAVATDKIVYRPGEHGTAVITLANAADTPVDVALSVAMHAGLTTRREIASTILHLAAGGTAQWTGDFSTDNLHWGAEITADARVTGLPAARARAVFGVTDNFWETAIVGGIYQDKRAYARDPALAEANAAQLRHDGFTAMESGFWAPDEFGQFVPDKEGFFGGQFSYPGSVLGTTNIIAACHRHGIATTVYALMYGGDGAPTFAMMRKHPDWFSSSSGATDWVEQWYLQETGKTKQFPVWLTTNINQANCNDAIGEHAAQLVAGHRALGWDGVRYDSYYSMAWKAATQRIRTLVQREEPAFRFGYNSSVSIDVRANALDTMIGGGNLEMEESIRSITKRGGAFSDYANTTLTYRDIVWPHGGHLGVCYDAPSNDAQHTGTPADALYLASILLENDLGHHPRFALRYSEFLYDNTLRPLLAPDTVIAFGGAPALLEWKRMARAVDLGADRHRLILHLLNAPANNQCMGNPEMTMPLPLRNLPVTVTLPAGAVVDGAWLLSPIPDAHHDTLTGRSAGSAFTITVPEVRVWGVVVIDYRAPNGVAMRTTASDEEVAMRTPPREKPAPTPAEPAQPLTDEEAAAKAHVIPPAEWLVPASRPLHVLAVHGLWYPEYGVERALARLGGAVIDDSWEFLEDSLRFYPSTYEALMRYHLVVVCNVGASSFTPVQRKMLKEYVAHGGTVLFLGGWYAFGPDYHHSLFEEISPVTYPEKRNDPPNSDSPGVWRNALPDGLVLAPGEKSIGDGLNWAAGPRVFWYHPLTPKPGTTVLLTAGGQPLLVMGAYGKGRVAVFAGTVMGDPPAGKLPFWQWDGWPSLLADAIRRITTASGTLPTALSTEARGNLSEQLFGRGAKKASRQTALIAGTANLCGDRETAKLLLEGIAELEEDAPQALIEQVSTEVYPYVDGSFMEIVQRLLDSGQVQKTSLGLRVLGRTNAATAQATLETALTTGELSVRDNPGETDAPGHLIDDPTNAQYAIRLGALEGLGQAGNPASIPLLRDFMQRFARTRSKLEDTGVYLLSQDDELYLQAALAALRCGDADAARPVVDALLANQYVIIRQIRLLDTDYQPFIFGNDRNLKAMVATARAQFSRVYARQPQLYRQLTALPPAVLPALAKRLAVEEDSLVTPIFYSAFGRGDGHPITLPGVATRGDDVAHRKGQ